MKQIMIFTFCFLTMGVSSINAQVNIGATTVPSEASLLELKTQEANNPTSVTSIENVTSTKGGLGLPRVKLVNKTTLQPFVADDDAEWIAFPTSKIKEKHAGLTVYNIYVSAESETNINKIFRQGVYTWDGSTWDPVFQGKKFFPCPAFNLPLPRISTPTDPEFTYDLYGEYAKQFTESNNNLFISNNSSLDIIAPQNRKRLYKENELDFVVTYYDESVLEITGIDQKGVMSYHVLNHAPDADAFINLIFVIKE